MRCSNGVTLVVLVAGASLAHAQARGAQGTSPGSSSVSPPGDTRNVAAAPHTRTLADTTGSPVVFAGDTLLRLYGALGPFAAAERAAAAADRLRRIAPGFAVPGDSVLVVSRETLSEIVVGDAVLMTVLDTDAAPLNVARPDLAAAYARRIQVALSASARRLSLRALVAATGYAALATIVVIILLRFIAVGFPKLYKRLDALRRLRLPALRIQQFELASAERLSQLLLFVARALRIGLTLVILYIYVPLVLSFLPWTTPLSRRIVDYSLTPLAAVANGALGYVPNLFSIAVIVLVARYVLKLVHAFFRAVEHGALTFDGFYQEWAEPTYKIVRVLVLAFTGVVVFPYLPGAHADAFKGVSIFLGVIFSLGSSSAISNVVAGVVLTYTRAFRIGDRVQIAETTGDVTEKTLLVTRIRTIKNEEVTIPNGTVLASRVVNYTTLAADRGLVLHTSVTIGYDAPWARVHELLLTAARRTENLLADPRPFVLQTSLDDFYVTYQLNACTRRPDVMAATYSQLHGNIQDAFNEAGVEIMSPHYRSLRDGNALAVPPNALSSDGRSMATDVTGLPEVRA